MNFEGDRRGLFEKDCQRISVNELKTYVGICRKLISILVGHQFNLERP